MSELVRRSVDAWLERIEDFPDRDRRWSEALAVFGSYDDPSGETRVAEDHDRHLAVAAGAVSERRR